jgi:hypothetical protein
VHHAEEVELVSPARAERARNLANREWRLAAYERVLAEKARWGAAADRQND